MGCGMVFKQPIRRFALDINGFDQPLHIVNQLGGLARLEQDLDCPDIATNIRNDLYAGNASELICMPEMHQSFYRTRFFHKPISRRPRTFGPMSIISFALIFLVLYSRYSSTVLAAIFLTNIPLVLIGSVAALWIARLAFSVASWIGFITLAGISARNGIL